VHGQCGGDTLAAEDQVYIVSFGAGRALGTAQEWSVVMLEWISLRGQKILSQVGGDPQIRLGPSGTTQPWR
jgi:hypothetical protein